MRNDSQQRRAREDVMAGAALGLALFLIGLAVLLGWWQR